MNLARESSGRGTSVLLWVLAVVITLMAVVYQRMIGPTRPVRGKVTVASAEFHYQLERTFGGKEGAPVRIGPVPESVSGILVARRYRTDDPWDVMPMRRDGDHLVAFLPHQPPAGKVVYRIFLREGVSDSTGAFSPPLPPPVRAINLATAIPEGAVAVPSNGPIVLRYRGSVPAPILITHVLLMFLGMLWSNRAGIEALRGRARPKRYAFWTLGLLAAGGLVFGPLVQWYSFGKFWTGFPFGFDLTDNKTLIAVVFWVAAAVAVLYGARRAAGKESTRVAGGPGMDADGPAAHGPATRAVRVWVLAAAVITLVIFSIPHSVIGSELDYSKQTISTVR